jgi:hypothetical protein
MQKNVLPLPLQIMKIVRYLPLLIFLASCEKAIEFTPRTSTPDLVVEATIETNKYPIVYLTHSLNYFSQISPDELVNSFVRNAVVTISNGTLTHTLKEHEIPLAPGYSIFYYSVDSTNLSTAFKGKEEGTYSLTIEVDGKKYESTTTIPKLSKVIDSLYYEKNVDVNDSSKVVLYGKFTDPPGFGNYIRYFTSVNGGNYFPGLASVFDDQVIDGKSYKLQIEQGVDRNSDIDFEEYSYFHRGDSISVKFCNIDKAVYDFWRTMEYSYSSIGNPFSSPTRVMGNISNGALGYFGGYAVQYAHIIIPE